MVQRGKHAELLEQEGLYRRIFDLELRDQEEALGRPTPGSVAASALGNGRAGAPDHAESGRQQSAPLPTRMLAGEGSGGAGGGS